MSLLPGGRNRTLAPTGVIGEADLVAMERANAALAEGAHGLVEQQLEILGGRRASGWAGGGEDSIAAGGADSVVRFDLRQWAGNTLASVDVWSMQLLAGAAMEIYVEVQRAREGTVDPIAYNADAWPVGEFAKRSIGLINATAGRKLGWMIPTSPLEVPTLRLHSFGSGETVVGVTLWFQRARTT